MAPNTETAFFGSIETMTSRPAHPLTLYPHAWRSAPGVGR